MSDPLLSFGGVDSQSGILTDVLQAFLRFISNGGTKIVAKEAQFAGALLGLQFVKMVTEIGLSRRVAGQALFTFITSALWYQAAMNGVALVQAWMGFMGALLSEFSGGTIGGDIMHNPSLIVELGLKDFSSLMDSAFSYDNPLFALVAVLAFTLLGIIVILAFIFLGAIALVVVIRQTIDAMLGLTLLPFVIEPRTSFLAARGLGLIIDAGLKMGATSIALGVSYGFIKEIHLQPTPTLRDGVNLVVATIACLFISGGAALLKPVAGAAIRATSGKSGR